MLEKGFNQYIREIRIERKDNMQAVDYPFSLEAVRSLKKLELHPNVTFIIGENGSGKSTLLEGIAVALGFNPEGGSMNIRFSTEDTHSELYESIKISRGTIRPKDGFFLRAESFYNLASSIDRVGDGTIAGYGGVSLHEQSHGESFMSLLINRLGGRGLYIFDEPEAALSPSRQMALLRCIHDLVKADSQLIIATHSPIIMAYPHATIYRVDQGYQVMKYCETEHFLLMRDFLNNHERMVELLLED